MEEMTTCSSFPYDYTESVDTRWVCLFACRVENFPHTNTTFPCWHTWHFTSHKCVSDTENCHWKLNWTEKGNKQGLFVFFVSVFQRQGFWWIQKILYPPPLPQDSVFGFTEWLFVIEHYSQKINQSFRIVHTTSHQGRGGVLCLSMVLSTYTGQTMETSMLKPGAGRQAWTSP